MQETIESIKKDELNNQMEFAANALFSDYANDKDLTAFINLDFEMLTRINHPESTMQLSEKERY